VDAVLEALSGGLAGAPALALLASAGWGAASMLLSPCHLAGIPLIIGFIASSQGELRTGRAAAVALAFAAGILATIAALGVVTALLGRTLGEVGPLVIYAVAGLFLVVGLELVGAIRLPRWSVGGRFRAGGGAPAAFGLGLAFGLVLGPCTFAFLAPVLGAAMAVGVTAPLLAGALVLAFGVGHCGVIVLAGSSTGFVPGILDWNERSRALTVFRRASGVLVIVGAIYLIYTA
jgi:cytochrome c-type biogenesis protein